MVTVKLEAIWEKIEDWFDDVILDKWEHCYVSFDDEGRLVHVQSSGRGFCQGGHYLRSGHYDWDGKTRLKWTHDEEGKRGVVTFPSGREAKRWSGYLAVILFPTKRFQYSYKWRRYMSLWDGSLPKLLFKRSRASHRMYEIRGRLFSNSRFVSQEEADSIKLPKHFLEVTLIYHRHLLRLIEELKKGKKI